MVLKEDDKLKQLKELLEKTINFGASDLHLSVGVEPTIRITGQLSKIFKEKLTPEDTNNYAKEILGEEFEDLLKKEK